MHIEPGFVAPAKVAIANAGAIGVFAWGCKEQIKEFLRQPAVLLKSLLAAGFFSLFMQSFHMPVGPSELHFVGAMAMYLTLGFTPTLLGFAIGLLFQGLVFDPGDLYHLGVNSLSLMLPLISVHYIAGRHFFDPSVQKRLSWARIVKLDAMYYGGVTGMVGFWLVVGDVATPLSAWASFAGSYLAIVAFEPVVTYLGVRGLKSLESNGLVARLTAVRELRIA
ncbi:MAG: energy-coupling factor ABC transporter permease [Alphaproteobacteria bacterium]|jgi:ABC-type Co2+ transport system permease subunit|nr:energy-coupling factor ABC transporter permease [Alphaproteobacteria bacterium]